MKWILYALMAFALVFAGNLVSAYGAYITTVDSYWQGYGGNPYGNSWGGYPPSPHLGDTTYPIPSSTWAFDAYNSPRWYDAHYYGDNYARAYYSSYRPYAAYPSAYGGAYYPNSWYAPYIPYYNRGTYFYYYNV